jgi:hypothetical protein
MGSLTPRAGPWLLRFIAALRIGRNPLMPEGADLQISLTVERH